MKRIPITSRDGWEKKIIDQGFVFYDYDQYYNERCAYEFTTDEIEQIEKATVDIFNMCLAVVDHVITHKLWDEFFIPRQYADLITWSWNNDNPSFYGRFDLGFNNGEIKLFEFNADTPTALLEASVVQWYWLQEYNDKLDQFNNIHEQLLAHMRICRPWLLNGKLHFSSDGNAEDFMTVKYLQDVADQAGIPNEFIYIDDISVNRENLFTDRAGNLISNIFKLYPYEWMFREPFGAHLIANRDTCLWIEPAYKAILSNKMILKYLYLLFPDSPYILPCTFSRPGDTVVPPSATYAKKPVFSREGANVSVVSDGKVIEENGGDYGEEGFLYQQYFELPDFDGNRPIVGSWLIGGKPAGIGIRESSGLITNNTSRFCPHYIK